MKKVGNYAFYTLLFIQLTWVLLLPIFILYFPNIMIIYYGIFTILFVLVALVLMIICFVWLLSISKRRVSNGQ